MLNQCAEFPVRLYGMNATEVSDIGSLCFMGSLVVFLSQPINVWVYLADIVAQSPEYRGGVKQKFRGTPLQQAVRF
jgi:hypothetical protein